MRAGPQALQHVLGVVVHAENQDAGLGREPAQLRRHLQTRDARHRDVEHRDVGPELARPAPAPRRRSTASPTTANPGSPSSTWRMPVRTMAWSSATSTRMAGSLMTAATGVGRNQTSSERAAAAPRRRTARCRPARRCAPACRPDPCGPRRSDASSRPPVETTAVVPHLEQHARRARREADLHRRRARVAGHVRRAPPAARGRGPAPPPRRAAAAPTARRARCGCRSARRSRPTSERRAGSEAQVVEQRGPEIVGDVPDAPDAGVDQLEHLIEPRRLPGRDAVAQHAELHLDRGEHLRGLVVELAGEPAALLLVLLDHPGGEPGQLDGAGLQPAVEIGVLQRGADLLAQRHQEARRPAR